MKIKNKTKMGGGGVGGDLVGGVGSQGRCNRSEVFVKI